MSKKLEVAAKRARVDAGVEATNAFLEEAMVMSQFHHRNILRLLGVCTTGRSNPSPLATDTLLENTGGVGAPQPCSLGVAACYLPFFFHFC